MDDSNFDDKQKEVLTDSITPVDPSIVKDLKTPVEDKEKPPEFLLPHLDA